MAPTRPSFLCGLGASAQRNRIVRVSLAAFDGRVGGPLSAQPLKRTRPAPPARNDQPHGITRVALRELSPLALKVRAQRQSSKRLVHRDERSAARGGSSDASAPRRKRPLPAVSEGAAPLAARPRPHTRGYRGGAYYAVSLAPAQSPPESAATIISADPLIFKLRARAQVIPYPESVCGRHDCGEKIRVDELYLIPLSAYGRNTFQIRRGKVNNQRARLDSDTTTGNCWGFTRQSW